MNKIFKVELRYWGYWNGVNDKTNATLIKDFQFIQKSGEKKTIKDVKNFVQEQSITVLHDPVCTCFLTIWESTDEQKINISFCKDYKDNTPLDATVFNENKEIIVIIDCKGRDCKCGNLQNNITISNALQKLEEENRIAKQKQEENEYIFNNKIEELMQFNYQIKKENEREIKSLNNLIEFQKDLMILQKNENNKKLKQLENELKINSKKLEENEKKEKVVKINKEKAEKTFLKYQELYYEKYFNNNSESIISEFIDEINKLKISFDDMKKDVISEILEKIFNKFKTCSRRQNYFI